MTPTLSVLGPEHYAPFRALRGEALESSPRSYGTGAEDWRAASEEAVTRMLEHSRSQESGFILGAWVEGVLVGVLGLKREAKAKARHKATLWGFFVQPGFRDRGVGGALVDEAMARAAQMDGLHLVRLMVTAPDAAALHVVEARGFTRYGLERDGLSLNGAHHDIVYLMRFVYPV